MLLPGNPPFGVSDMVTGETVKLKPLLACPATVTTTAPLVAAPGTGTEIVVAFQLVGVAAAPLKVTVLAP